MNEEQRLTPFHHILTYLNKGCINDEATEANAEVVRAVRQTKKKGRLVIQLDYAMQNNMNEDAIQVAATLKKTVPEPDQEDTILYSTYDGDLFETEEAQEDKFLSDFSDPNKRGQSLKSFHQTLKKAS